MGGVREQLKKGGYLQFWCKCCTSGAAWWWEYPRLSSLVVHACCCCMSTQLEELVLLEAALLVVTMSMGWNHNIQSIIPPRGEQGGYQALFFFL